MAPADTTAAPTGVIHDIGYQRYTGPRLGRRQVFGALYLHGVRTVFGLGRSAKAKIFPWLVVSVVTVVAAGVTAVRSQIGEVERICDTLVAIDGGRLLRADRVSAMTTATDVLAVEVSEGTEELAARLAALDLPVTRDGRLLLVPLADDATYDQILGAVAELDLPLHRLDQRRHRVAELFATRELTHA